jgi:tetratricopeptide (TPR) repeat protein
MRERLDMCGYAVGSGRPDPQGLTAQRAAASVTCAATLCALLWAAPARADARIDCYVKSGEAAIRACTEALARNPHDVASYISRAYEYHEKGEHALSLADYAKAIELDPNRWEAFQGRAWAYLKLGKAADALADAETAVKLRPNAAHALDARGHALEALGRREDAIADFRRALALEPRLQGSREGLKRLGQ